MNRRRKVQFTAPTYVEASDVEYSTEEEGEEGEGEYLPNEEDRSEQQEPEQEPRADDDAVVETLKAGSVVDATSEPQTQVKQTATGTDQPSDVDRARTSDEMFDYTGTIASGLRSCTACADSPRRWYRQQVKERHSSEHGFFLQG